MSPPWFWLNSVGSASFISMFNKNKKGPKKGEQKWGGLYIFRTPVGGGKTWICSAFFLETHESFMRIIGK